MNLRLYLPGLLWVGAMILVFITPIQTTELFFNQIPPRSLIHAVLFLGFTHTSMCALKKQLKHDQVRSYATFIVIGLTAVLILISELFMTSIGASAHFSSWNIFFDIIGAALGIGGFKLLYRSCC